MNNGDANLYLTMGSPAGEGNNDIGVLNCLSYTTKCSANGGSNYQCQINIPYCQTVAGTYTLAVYGADHTPTDYVSTTKH
jgi:hypothetical protein